MKKTIITQIMALTVGLASTGAFAINDQDGRYNVTDDNGRPATLILLRAPGGGYGSPQGEALLTDNPNGPDQLRIEVKGLNTWSSFSIQLTQSATTGALPSMFLGEIRTNGQGYGIIEFKTEITNAYVNMHANTDTRCVSATRTPGTVADVVVAGARKPTVGCTPTPIRVPWIRIYESQGSESFIDAVGGSSFGKTFDALGGANVLTSVSPIGPVQQF